ncbi:2'-5' RNA ligase family protein [Clostridium estertheticum]|uniref:2'-5' RNA ligase family protein n=1 Tax=Clostridium estertheticum TaxID=238834 RepID=A0AA47I457_9CLOT|nr:2'-5' RNA ligase family protein [Clostridium estertheticum]MBU3158011.1 2'-5' RNA ligase family protein [Clostridium estertheticum]WAG58867.1 2'-5' RNA ligase family protein [Clostridium estertheticum]
MNSNIKKRTIMIFPQFENINIINEIRKKYDPLANHVSPHITLVFTFESGFTSIEINEHLKKVIDETRCFRLTLQEIVKIDNPLGRYLFLDIKQGNEQIKELSKKLYTGILNNYKPAWLNEETFMPHMTIGDFTSKENLNIAFKNTELIKENFTTIVDKISVEIIDENEDSIIEVEVDLKPIL